MKKQIITILAASSLSLSAFAQGSINTGAFLSNNPGVTTQGANARDTVNATTWYTGNMSLSIWYAATNTAAQLTAINSFLNVANGSASAMALLLGDGYVQASTTAPSGSTVGSVTGAVNGGTLVFNPTAIGLTGVPTASAGFLALVGTAVGGVNAGWSGVMAFANNTGGSPISTPPGTAASLTGWNTLNQNFVLSQVPEPTTLALAALGGASLLLFRRKK